MKIIKNKKYTYAKQKGNKGAAYLEYFLTDFVLMHRVDEAKDLGNDFICELVDGEFPTRVLFFIQCKAYKRKPSLSDFDEKTLSYWKGFDIPVFIFWVNIKDNNNYRIEYQRLTPFLHKGSRHKNEKFKMFEKEQFILDLFVDSLRCFNRRGMLPGINIKKYISDSKTRMAIFNSKLTREYRKELEKHGWVGSYLLGVLYFEMEDNKSRRKGEECFRFALKYMPKQVPYDSEEYDFFVEYAYLVMRNRLGEI